MKKRIITFVLVLLMLFNTVPVGAVAAAAPEQSDVKSVGDFVWLAEGEEPAYPIDGAGKWVSTGETRTESITVCAEEVHEHVIGCPTDENGAYICGGHQHSDECGAVETTVYACGEEAHEHAAECPVDENGAYTCGGHEHSDECAGVTNIVYACGEAAHEHVLGCPTDETGAYTCGGHEHGDECFTQLQLVKWTVAAPIKAAAPKAADSAQGLPVHFFLAAPDQVTNPNGRYIQYRNDLWGKENGTAGYAYAKVGVGDTAPIRSQQGIRNANDESAITSNIYTLPSSGGVEMTMDQFKTFGSVSIPGAGTFSYADGYRIKWVSICWRNDGSRTYWERCGCGADYDHIHIDGILTKVVEPGEMKLYKQLDKASSEDQTFTFTLERLQQNANYTLPAVEAKDTSFADMTLTATVPALSTAAVQIDGIAGAELGFGYYKLTETESNDAYKQKSIKIGNNTSNTTGPLYIWINTDGSVQYSTSYRSGYTTAASATLINEVIPTKTVSVEKVWNDDNNRDGIRPESVEVHLLKNSAHSGRHVTLDASNNWKATWTVPTVDHNGNTIAYHVEEVVPAGYTAVVTGNEETGFVITNSHANETTNVVAHKVWLDDDNRDGLRPDSIRLQLYANGAAYGSPVTVNEDSLWRYEWDNLIKNSEGKPIEYSVTELATPEGYNAPTYSADDTGRLVVTNSRDVSKINVSVSKTWSDDNNRDGIRPASVTVTLHANGIALTSAGTTQVLSAENSWTYTWTDLYENYHGQKINYTVIEQAVEGYEVDYSKTEDAEGNAAISITNTHVPSTVSVPVTKVWNDADNQDGLRTGSVTVELYADSVKTDKTLTLSAANNWAGVFEDLPAFKEGGAGAKIEYTVAEQTVPSSYTAAVTGDAVNGYVITNTHDPVSGNLTVNKVWNDADNQDGVRPAEVQVTLYANGHPLVKGENGPDFAATEGEVYTLTLSDDNSWTDVWEDMPRYHNGQRISYTVVESGYFATVGGTLVEGLPTGYSVTHKYETDAQTNNGVATITNSYTPMQTSINVQKVWNDDDNRDGVRPASITVRLERTYPGKDGWEPVKDADGKDVTAVLSAANEWDHDFDGLPVKYKGKTISYQVVETGHKTLAGEDKAGLPDGYTAVASFDPNTRVVTITNNYTTQKTGVSVSKTWEDANNQDGLRPESVTVRLYANNVDMGDAYKVVLDASNSWSAAWEGLNANYAGSPIVYTVVEETVPTGYTAAVTGSAANGFVITNTHETEKTSVPVYKVWDDADNRDGARPESVTVKLYANGKEVESVDLSATNNWHHIFAALDKYENGEEIAYTIDEATVPTGYTKAISGNAVNGFTVTNSHTPEKISFAATKVWDDLNNRDGVRPESVEFHLLANGEHMQELFPDGNYKVTVTTDDEGNWIHTWENLYKYRNGKEIIYSVMEKAVDGYSTSYAYSGNTATVTNSHTSATVSVTVAKIWSDDDNRDGARPQNVNVQLLANGKALGEKIQLSANNSWEYTWTELFKYENGAAITYTVEEDEVSGYDEPVYTVDKAGTLVITNNHTPERTSFSVSKVWNDENNRDSLRPEKITVHLLANGEHMDKLFPNGNYKATVTADDEGNWTHTWENLYKYRNGDEIVYTVMEEAVAGYSTSYAYRGNSATVTNTHEIEKISVSATKVWDDADNQDGIRPASVSVKLMGSDTKDDDGNNIWYEVKDSNDQTVTAVLSAANNWSYTFSGLDKHKAGAQGQKIEYAIEEISVPTGYTKVITGDAANGFIVTNSYTPISGNLAVKKVWNDANDQDGKRPTNVVITLYANGKALIKGENGPDFAATEGVAYTLTLGENNSWSGVWENMPRYHNGQRVSYTVVETGYYETANGSLVAGVPTGYSVTYDYVTDNETHNGVVTITNSYTPEETSINVQKIWSDDDNRDGIRPESIEVELIRSLDGTTWENVKDDESGEDVTAVLSPANEWDHVFLGLPLKANGEDIAYSVLEKNVPEGYTASIKADAAARIVTITNTHEVQRTSISVSKSWDDANDQDGKRPDSVTVTLYANGVATNETATLSDENNWQHEWNNLYAFYNGSEIYYDVAEEAVTGYEAEYVRTVDSQSGNVAVEFTNKHTPAKTSVSANKVWNDEDNRDGKRPASVEIVLYANGVAADREVLSATNNWQHVFTELDVYENGEEIAYTVDEEVVPAGYTKAISGDAENGYTVTNSRTPERISFTANKRWADHNNQDGLRPQSVEFHLLANGEHMDELFPGGNYKVTVTADGEGNWTYTWENLYKYRNGKEIIYTVIEKAVDEYSASYTYNGNTATVTNSRTPYTVSVTTTKIWSDEDNRDGARPARVIVQLLANGYAYGTKVELSTANKWEYTWQNLPKNENGVPIIYTVVEDEVRGYDDPVYTVGAAGALVITNSRAAEKVSFTASKVWEDDNNRDGLRPDKVVLHLMANGEHMQELFPNGNYKANVTAADNWTHTWDNLYKYRNGKEIVYTVMEEAVAGYSTEYEYEGYSATVTNTHEIEKISATATKVWDDANDQDGIRPSSVNVELYADGVATGKTASLTAENGWSHTFSELDKYKAGKVGTEVVYTIAETSVPEGYTASVNGMVVTNSHTPITGNLSVKKIWNDADNQDGLRPAKVVISLFANGKALMKGENGPDFAATEGEAYALTLSEENNWEGVWNDMPRYHNGQRVSYTVVETGYYETANGSLVAGVPEGYSVEHRYDTNAETHNGVAYVTNTHIPMQTAINVQKVWNDDDNRDGIRPASVTVKLQSKYANGSAGNDWTDVIGENGNTVTAILSPDNEWDYDFLGLPLREQGKNLIYKVVEVGHMPVGGVYKAGLPAGYTADAVFDTVTRVVTITNTHEVKRVDVSVSKTWEDADNQDGIRPESVKVTLYANGIATSETVTLSEANGWKYKWDDLYACYKGSEIYYDVVEEAVEGYEVKPVRTQDDGGNVAVALTNKHTPAKVSVSVSKIWEDDDDRDGLRPDTLEVTLYANDQAVKKETLSAAKDWEHVFEGLDKYAAGTAIVYTVSEDTVPAGYTASVVRTKDDATGNINVAITNKHESELMEFTAVKVWDDDDNRDGVRPDTITLHLLANGEHMNELFPDKGYMVTLAEDDKGEWTYTWKNLYKYRNGEAIRYTVYEEPITDDTAALYNASYKFEATKATITNTHEIATTEVMAIKVWDDGDDRDCVRPDEVKVKLVIDGTASDKELTLSETNAWEGVWTELPKYRDGGTEIEYTVSEEQVAEYELPDIKEDTYSAGTFIVTNTHKPETTGVSVKKIWSDDDNRDGIRPEGIIVQLYADGNEVVGGREILSEENYWSYSWVSSETMPLYVNKAIVNSSGERVAVQIEYTVLEVGYVEDGTEYDGLPEGYVGSDPSVKGYEVTITNSHAIKETELTIKKLWGDNNNVEKTRPDSIKLNLYADGELYESLTLTAAGAWTYKITVPVYNKGERIVWTVEEVDIPKGYTVSYNQEELTVTNYYISKDIPKTGDDSHLGLWIGLFAVFAAGAGGVFFLGKKKKKEED